MLSLNSLLVGMHGKNKHFVHFKKVVISCNKNYDGIDIK